MTDLLKDDLVHILLLRRTLIFALDAEEMLLEWHRSERRIEKEETWDKEEIIIDTK